MRDAVNRSSWPTGVPFAVVWLCLAVAPVAHAQGQIYGIVENADLSNPAAGALLWLGFLDGTDEEVRIESNTGAGYDGLHWFDDFQNYTTEAAGNPYDYLFVNAINGEGVHLQKTIPLNSFQEEDITLSPASPPARPAGLTAHVMSPSQIDLQWNSEAGLTYHVYRRVASNNSVFYRLDDPSGNLASHGVAGSSFADLTSDGASEYAYIIMAEDQAGNYSAHSEQVTILASESGCLCPKQGDLDGDGFATALDLSDLIDVLFAGRADVHDGSCPSSRSDIDCDGFATSLDLSKLIDHLFAGGAGPCDPCVP